AVDLGSLLAGDAPEGQSEQYEREDVADRGEDSDGTPVLPQSTPGPDPSLPEGCLALSALGEVSWELIEALTARLVDVEIAGVVAGVEGLVAEWDDVVTNHECSGA